MPGPGEIRFEFVTEGEQSVSQALLDIKVKQNQAAQAATQLAQELAKIKASGQLSAQGIQSLERELAQAQVKAQQFAQQAAAAQRAERQLAEAAANTTNAVRNQGRQMGSMVNVFAEFGYSMGSAIPGMQQFGTQIAMMGGSAYQLGAALGPVGVAIGVVTGLMPTLISAMSGASSSASDMASSVSGLGTASDEAATRLQQLTQAMVEADQQQQRYAGVATTTTDVESGLGDAMDRRRAIVRQLAEANTHLAEAERRRQQLLENDAGPQALHQVATEMADAAREVVRLDGNIRDANDEIRLLEEGMRRAQQAGSQFGRFDTGESEFGFASAANRARRIAERQAEAQRSARQGTGAARRHQNELDARLAREQSFYDELQRLRDQDMAADARAAQQREDTRIRIDREVDAIIRREDEEARRRRERERQREEREATRRLREQQREAQRATERVKSDALDVLQPAVQGITQALTDVIAGTKSADQAFQGLLASFLEMIAQQAALEAAKEFASAIGSFASQDYGGGALHLAAGVAWTAVAVASGAASVAVAPPAAATPASPQQQAGGGNANAGPTVINIDGPIVTAGTRAQLGRELGRLVDEGGRRFGRAA